MSLDVALRSVLSCIFRTVQLVKTVATDVQCPITNLDGMVLPLSC